MPYLLSQFRHERSKIILYMYMENNYRRESEGRAAAKQADRLQKELMRIATMPNGKAENMLQRTPNPRFDF